MTVYRLTYYGNLDGIRELTNVNRLPFNEKTVFLFIKIKIGETDK